MNTLLAQIFGEVMSRPVWEDPGVFASPAALASYAGIWALWSGFSEFRKVVAAFREAWPHIKPVLLLVVEALRKIAPDTPMPEPVVVQTPVVQADATAAAPVTALDVALAEWKAAKAAGNKADEELWGKKYNELKAAQT